MATPLRGRRFFGEEISMSARLWTAGWDFFHPTCECRGRLRRAVGEVVPRRLGLAPPRIAYHLASRAHRYWFREVQSSEAQRQREKLGKLSAWAAALGWGVVVQLRSRELVVESCGNMIFKPDC
eukprot:Skav219903  [mRNA]  locus=scaffold5195:11819:12613:- [translate_table: standard]